MSEERTAGIHHVTAIAGDPQRNLDFYTQALGLRCVKRTVNFDDPGSYHLYFGDGLGRPGTILTFFAWPGAPRGRAGTGQVRAVAFAVPPGSLGFWRERLRGFGAALYEPEERFGEGVLPCDDPDGVRLELVGSAAAEGRPAWDGGPVAAENAIRGLHGVTLAERDPGPAAAILGGTLGLEPAGEAGNRVRHRAGGGSGAGGGGAGEPGAVVDLLRLPGDPRGEVAAGTVHHVAFRARDDGAQQRWGEALARRGLQVTPVLDRCYFRSIYFREPGGVLFEIATDGPGFTVDEPAEALGGSLRLPPWLEDRRAVIEGRLPRVELRGAGGSG